MSYSQEEQRQLLKAVREEFDWRQEDAAASCGVSLRAWESYESLGEYSRKAPEMLFRLLEALRELRLRGLSWEEFNAQVARKAKASILRPEEAEYRAGGS